jgi:hypothetical protein
MTNKKTNNESDIELNVKNKMTEKEIQEVMKYFTDCIEWFFSDGLETLADHLYVFNDWEDFSGIYGFENKYKNVIEIFDKVLPFVKTNIKIDSQAIEELKKMEAIKIPENERDLNADYEWNSSPFELGAVDNIKKYPFDEQE